AAEARGKTLSEACRDFAEQLAREVEPLSQHEKWLKKQVELAVAKANSGDGRFTSNEEVKRVMASRKDEIRAKYKR
ncbi:damage-inducible protein J, partial [Salmonella enterica subsp. enterica serovar Enteritidis]|nr:damage-inducible protein J [Salmonella enterica subsp. enterica serovar Enteritidis]